MIESLIDILLARGEAARALPWIEQQRVSQPNDQRWITHWLDALRVSGDPRYHELCDYRALVQCHDLDAPTGWGSISELNRALQSALGTLHQLRRHPLDQSLRGGSQTTRSLLAERDAAVRALLQACQAPLRTYAQRLSGALAQLGFPHRVGEPVIAKCWSVQLHAGGYHVPHIHPEGWISSVYYVAVPAEALDSPSRAGWLKFGEPAISRPGCSAEHFVQPVAGRLVLFPSFLWHGTEPMTGAECRLTVAFDAIPA